VKKDGERPGKRGSVFHSIVERGIGWGIPVDSPLSFHSVKTGRKAWHWEGTNLPRMDLPQIHTLYYYWCLSLKE
jgi:hypothetical protein